MWGRLAASMPWPSSWTESRARPSLHPGRQGDAPPGRGVFDGVVHQDAQGLLGEAHVGPHGHRLLPPGGRRVGLVDHLGLLEHLGGHLGQVEDLHLDVHGVVVPPGQEEQLLHQLLHGVGLGPDGVDGLLPGGGVVLAPAVEQVGVPLDDRDGGAQLMAGVGDEAHLGAVGLVDPVQHGVDGLRPGSGAPSGCRRPRCADPGGWR